MRSPFTRLGVVACSLLALGTTTPPAQAFTVMHTTFVAEAFIPAGVGHIITTAGSVLPIVVPTTSCLPLQGVVAAPNCHFTYNNLRGMSLSSLVCRDTSININKSSLAPEHIGVCLFGASGTMSGHCDPFSAQLSGLYTNSLGQDFSFNIHLNGAGDTTEFSGHWTKLTLHPGEPRRRGLVSGQTDLVPPNPVTGGGSCLEGTATYFVLNGHATWVTTP